MKSSIKKKTYKAMYRLLDKVSPIREDCGALCGSACCGPRSDVCADSSSGLEFGMYLLPGEEKLFTRKEDWLLWNVERAEDYDFPESWKGKVYFVKCKGAPNCVRELRPIQCRTFPLQPFITEDGIFHLILHSGELPYQCPLIEQTIPLDERFIRATYTVWKRLLKDPLILDLVEMDSRIKDSYL
jgi:hypothetical protein